MSKPDASAVIAALKAKLKEFDGQPELKRFHKGTFRAWAYGVDSIIIRGTESPRITSKWRQAIKGLPYPNSMVTLGYEESILKFMFESRLPEVRATLEAIIDELEMFGQPPANDHLLPPPTREAKVFVAHGGESEALNKLASFLLEDLGIIPLIVERLPSEGRSVNENVEFYLDQAEAGIVLATGDDVVDGKLHARPNVHIEIGRFQERFPDRVIYLLEQNAVYN